MFRGHTSEWKSVSRGRARNGACATHRFRGEYHCKYMNNNAFAQVRRPFFRSPRPTKTRRCELASACPPQSSTRIRNGGGRRWSACIKRWNVATLSPRRTQGDRRKPVSDATTRGIGGSGARETLNPPPEGAAEAAGGGAPASSGGTSPRSPPDGGETPRDQSARNPRNRQVGCRGGSKSPRVPAPASGAAVAPPRPPTIDGVSGQIVAKPRRGGADIRPREWPDAPPKRAVRAWPWAIVRSRREKTAPPPCPRAGGRCGVNESMWTSGKNLT